MKVSDGREDSMDFFRNRKSLLLQLLRKMVGSRWSISKVPKFVDWLDMKDPFKISFS